MILVSMLHPKNLQEYILEKGGSQKEVAKRHQKY